MQKYLTKFIPTNAHEYSTKQYLQNLAVFTGIQLYVSTFANMYAHTGTCRYPSIFPIDCDIYEYVTFTVT